MTLSWNFSFSYCCSVALSWIKTRFY